MSHLLYGTQDDVTWIKLGPVKLPDVIHDYVRSESYRFPGGWWAHERDLLRTGAQWKHFPPYGPPKDMEAVPLLPSGYRNWFLVIDVKPNRAGIVSLYHLEHVWGYSEKTWTPLCLRLEPLFVDSEVQNSARFKNEFQLPPREERGGPVHEFLYLNHPDGLMGRWTWGRVGWVNGALLSPKALAYFIERIMMSGGVPLDFEYVLENAKLPPGLLAKLAQEARADPPPEELEGTLPSLVVRPQPRRRSGTPGRSSSRKRRGS